MVKKAVSKDSTSLEVDEAKQLFLFSSRWLRGRSISDKLLLGFGVILLLVGISGSMSLFGLRHVRLNYRAAIDGGLEIEQLAREAQGALRTARQHEKDFLLRWKEEGLEIAKEKYAQANRLAVDDFRNKMMKVLGLLQDVGASDEGDLRQHEAALEGHLSDLQVEARHYEEAFDELVQAIEEKGYEDTGLVGRFRRSAHEVEAWVKDAGLSDLRVELLELRRREKDYLLRGRQEFVVSVRQAVDVIRERAAKLSFEVSAQLDEYLKDFEAVVAIDEKVLGKRGVLRQTVEVVEETTREAAHLGRVSADADVQRAGEIFNETILFLFITTVVTLIAGIVLSYVLGKSITIPLRLLTSTTKEVGDGSLTARAPVLGSDEVGELAQRFNNMTGRLAKSRHALEEEKAVSEKLLLNILPLAIADRLRGGQKTIADGFDEASVLFADIVGFTKISSALSADEVVVRLNEIFSAFDDLTEIHGVEKIKTVGDAYMVASGIPIPREDHAEALAEMALGMREALAAIEKKSHFGIDIRIGLNCGPVVAGVIGKSKFIYDLWGNTVNVASRMESHGVPGKIQVTHAVFEKLKQHYQFTERGEIEVKGKGKMTTYFLVARRTLEPSS